MQKKKVIILVAINGNQSTEKGSFVPITPDELAVEAAKCARAGAGIVHIHARDPDTLLASSNKALFEECIKRIRAETDILIQTTTGVGLVRDPVTNELVRASFEDRLNVLSLDPPQDLATVGFGTWNFLRPGDTKTTVNHNTPDFIRKNLVALQKSKIPWEKEIAEVGFLYNALRLSEEGVFDRNGTCFWLDYLFGYGAMPPTARQLMFVIEEGRRLFPQARWQVNATGKDQFPMNTIGVAMGADIVRIGFEDSLFLPNGSQAKHNCEQVEAMADIIKYLGQEVASTNDAREILRIKK